MDDAIEHAGIVLALTCGLSNCVYYKSGLSKRIQEDVNLRGLTPPEIKSQLINHVRRSGAESVVQSRETRSEYRNHQYKYVVIVPFDDIPRGMFVEIVMHNPDRDPPDVLILSVHKSGV